MATKKVLAAVGLVCVITPAALAAMSKGGHSYTGYEDVKQAFSNLLGLYTVLDGAGDAGEARILERNGPHGGISRPAFRPANLLLPKFAELGPFELRFTNGDPFATVMLDESVIARAMAVTSGPVTTGGTAAGSAAGQSDADHGSTAGAGGSGVTDGTAGLGGATAGGVSGGGGGGGELDRMLLSEMGEVNVTDDTSTVTVMPVPASVWMLLGAITGLGVIGYRRGTA